MQMYQIDGSALSTKERLSVDQQLHALGYIYNSVSSLCEFTFYAEDNENVCAELKLPAGCSITKVL